MTQTPAWRRPGKERRMKYFTVIPAIVVLALGAAGCEKKQDPSQEPLFDPSIDGGYPSARAPGDGNALVTVKALATGEPPATPVSVPAAPAPAAAPAGEAPTPAAPEAAEAGVPGTPPAAAPTTEAAPAGEAGTPTDALGLGMGKTYRLPTTVKMEIQTAADQPPTSVFLDAGTTIKTSNFDPAKGYFIEATGPDGAPMGTGWISASQLNPQTLVLVK